MAKQLKGAVKFTHAGKSFTLQLDFNAICDFGDAIGVDGVARLEVIGTKPLTGKETRALFWAALQEHHPEIDLREAGRMVMACQAELMAAMQAMLPDADEGAAGNDQPA